MEWLANIKWQWVIVIVAVLAAIRLLLGKNKSPLAKQTAEVAESLAIAMALVFLLIRPFIIQAFFIPSGSMRPTLIERDHLLVNKFIYRFTDPKHGDIIVFKAPPSATPDGLQKDFIKRIIGEPGDNLEVKRGYVLIDGEEYDHLDLRALLVHETGQGELRVRLAGGKIFLSGREIDEKTVAIAAGKPGAKVVVNPGMVIRNGKKLNEAYIAEDPDRPFGPAEIDADMLFVMGDNRNDSNDSREWGQLEREKVLGKAMFIFWPPGRMQWIR
jgi:signal peptidase I